MEVRELSISDAYEITPAQHADDRGLFLEWFARDRFEAETGHTLAPSQANCSVSAPGVVRGIHFADVPPGQSKYVTCAAGAVLDVVVDLRTGSPTFGSWDSVRIDDTNRKAVYIAEGLGHAFLALEPGATLVYLCSEQYNPGRERSVHALDPDIGIRWPVDAPRLSPRDEASPGLAAAEAAGQLPSLADCRNHYARLRTL